MKSEVIKNLIKNIYYLNPNIVQLRNDGKKKEFKLDYHVSVKVASKLNRSYYFGTELKFETLHEYLETFKDLLKVKRALKELSK